MSEEGSYDRFLSRFRAEETDSEGLCLVNALWWVIEDLINNRQISDQIDFKKIRDLRKQQLERGSPLQRNLRDAWALFQGGTAAHLNNEAEIEIIEKALEEVKGSTGIEIAWFRRHFVPEQIDELREIATMPKTGGILLMPGHTQPLFPQKSAQELKEKLERGAGYGFLGGNVIFLALK